MYLKEQIGLYQKTFDHNQHQRILTQENFGTAIVLLMLTMIREPPKDSRPTILLTKKKNSPVFIRISQTPVILP